MKKSILCVLVISIFMITPSAYAGKVELTTYYPAPYGEYKTLKSTQDASFATTSGNVGIGTTSPNGVLDVTNASSAYSRKGKILLRPGYVGSPEGGVDLYNWIASEYQSNSSWDLGLGGSPYNGGNPLVTIKGNGNFGIGTTSPDTNLELFTNAGTSDIGFSRDAGPYTYGRIGFTDRWDLYIGDNVRWNQPTGTWYHVNKGGYEGQATLMSNCNGTIGLYTSTQTTDPITNWNIGLFINASGNVGIGTEAPTSGYALTVNGSQRVIGTLQVDNNLGWSIEDNAGEGIILLNSDNSTMVQPGPNMFRVVNHASTANNFIIYDNGTFYLGGFTSDSRIKLFQKPLSYGLKDVLKLKPKKYLRVEPELNGKSDKLVINKNKGKEDIGLVAQEVYQIMPELVTKPRFEEKELWGLNYNGVTAVLVKAIQEQQSEFEKQQQQIDSLKKEIAELKKQ